MQVSGLYINSHIKACIDVTWVVLIFLPYTSMQWYVIFLLFSGGGSSSPKAKSLSRNSCARVSPSLICSLNNRCCSILSPGSPFSASTHFSLFLNGKCMQSLLIFSVNQHSPLTSVLWEWPLSCCCQLSMNSWCWNAYWDSVISCCHTVRFQWCSWDFWISSHFRLPNISYIHLSV